MLTVTVTLHILSVMVLLGGIFFTNAILSPAVDKLFPLSLRLPLLSQTFTRFFPWMWIALMFLWITSLWLILKKYAHTDEITTYLYAMLIFATVVAIFFSHIFFVSFPNMKHAIEKGNLIGAGKYFNHIHLLMATTLDIIPI